MVGRADGARSGSTWRAGGSLADSGGVTSCCGGGSQAIGNWGGHAPVPMGSIAMPGAKPGKPNGKGTAPLPGAGWNGRATSARARDIH